MPTAPWVLPPSPSPNGGGFVVNACNATFNGLAGAPVPEGAGFARHSYGFTAPLSASPAGFVRLEVELRSFRDATPPAAGAPLNAAEA